MPKVIIFPLSLYMNNQQQNTEAAFSGLGVSKLALIWNYLPLPKFFEQRFRGPSLPEIFDKYRKGELSTSEFRTEIRAKFPNLNTIKDDDFDDAWNAMQEVSDLTIKAFEEIKNLEEKRVEVYLLAGTNPLHVEDIKNKSHLTELPGIPYFSYENKQLGKTLFSSLISHIYNKNNAINRNDIVFLYTVPQNPYPRLGIFAWLYDPVSTFKYKQATKYVRDLQNVANSQHGFTLIQVDPTNFNASEITRKLTQLGWFTDHKENKNLVVTESWTPGFKTTHSPTNNNNLSVQIDLRSDQKRGTKNNV